MQTRIPKKMFCKSYEDVIAYKSKAASGHNVLPYGIIRDTNFKQDNTVILDSGIPTAAQHTQGVI